MAGKGRAAYYGRGSMSERTPGAWRLRVMTSRGQAERIFRGSQTAAREALNQLAAEKPSLTRLPAAGDESVRTFGQHLDKWLEHLKARDRGRTVALDKRALSLLRRQRTWQCNLAKKAQSRLATDPYLLSDNANGARPIEPSKITDRFVSVRGKARIRGFASTTCATLT